jgi:hypothetical protein
LAGGGAAAEVACEAASGRAPPSRDRTDTLTHQIDTLYIVAYIVPALIADAGDPAAWSYVEFFTANIRNPNTQRAYARVCANFFD